MKDILGRIQQRCSSQYVVDNAIHYPRHAWLLLSKQNRALHITAVDYLVQRTWLVVSSLILFSVEQSFNVLSISQLCTQPPFFLCFSSKEIIFDDNQCWGWKSIKGHEHSDEQDDMNIEKCLGGGRVLLSMDFVPATRDLWLLSGFTIGPSPPPNTTTVPTMTVSVFEVNSFAIQDFHSSILVSQTKQTISPPVGATLTQIYACTVLRLRGVPGSDLFYQWEWSHLNMSAQRSGEAMHGLMQALQKGDSCSGTIVLVILHICSSVASQFKALSPFLWLFPGEQ